MRKKGGLSLANSLQEEYQKLVKMNYPELVTYLNNKYGPVQVLISGLQLVNQKF